MKVVMLGITYDVKTLAKETQDKANILGLYDSNLETIYLAADMPKGLHKRTFLHELIHMVDDHFEIGISEKQTSRFATGLLGVRVDGRGIIRL